MNSKKIVLWSVAVVAIGIFALPSTVSLFAGQHVWYDLTAGKNDVPCEKCHADIADEMQSGFNGAHRNLTCAMCHRTIFLDSDYTFASGEGSESSSGKRAHAAAVIECMTCHGVDDGVGKYLHDTGTDPEYEGSYDETCIACHWAAGTTMDADAFIAAGGFNLTGRSWDTGEAAAHMEFVLDAMDEELLEGANEACIACHTRIGVNITWMKSEYMNFTASKDETGIWSILDFTAEGTNITYVNTPNEWTNQ